MTVGDVERFLQKVKRGPGCWEWTAARMRAGYGVFWINGKNAGAHCIAYVLAHGRIGLGVQVNQS